MKFCNCVGLQISYEWVCWASFQKHCNFEPHQPKLQPNGCTEMTENNKNIFFDNILRWAFYFYCYRTFCANLCHMERYVRNDFLLGNFSNLVGLQMVKIWKMARIDYSNDYQRKCSYHCRHLAALCKVRVFRCHLILGHIFSILFFENCNNDGKFPTNNKHVVLQCVMLG